MQSINWLQLQEMRSFWIKQGHQNVPDPNCPCGYPGEDKPKCEIHNLPSTQYAVLK